MELRQGKFSPGMIVITANARRVLPEHEVRDGLRRHFSGDWGACCAEDRMANETAVRAGERIVSVYFTAEDTRFWIITEADRSATTVLLPEDY